MRRSHGPDRGLLEQHRESPEMHVRFAGYGRIPGSIYGDVDEGRADQYRHPGRAQG